MVATMSPQLVTPWEFRNNEASLGLWNRLRADGVEVEVWGGREPSKKRQFALVSTFDSVS
jgi:hypothetical protein